MAEHDERVKVTADVDLNVNSEKIDKIIDKLEKPITVKLDADGKGIFERVQKDITKIKKSVENIDFSGLAEQISSQMEKGADAGSKALQSAAKNVSSKEAYIQAERDLKTHQNKMLEIVKKAGDLALSHAEGNFLNDANRSNGKLKYTKDIEDTFNSLGKQLRNINTPDIEKFENWAKRVKNTLSPLIGDSYATSFVDYFNKATKDSVQFKNVLEDIDDATKEMNKLAPQIDFAENVQSEAEKAKQSVIDLSNVFEQVISKTSEGKNFTFGEAIEAMRNGIVGIRNTIDSISVKDGAGKVISLQITLDGLDTLKSQLQEADGAANNFQGSLQSINNLEIFSGISSQIKEISSAIESLSKNIKTMSYALDTIGASMDVPIPLKEMQRNQNKSAIDDIKARILEENKLIDDAYSQRTGIVAKNADEMNDVLKQKAPDGKGDTYLALIGKSEKNLSKGKELSDSQIKNLRIATDALEQYLALGGKVQDLEIANLKDGLTDDSFIVKAANEQLKVHQAEIEAATKSKAILEDELSHRQEILAIQDAQLTAAKSSQDAINASLQEELNYRTQITEAMKAQTDAMKAQNDVASSTNALLQEKIEDEKKKARKIQKQFHLKHSMKFPRQLCGMRKIYSLLMVGSM